tara:strand:+ start:1776 stop:2309 length:534 start_codon:yes stop_codon:yes gene_type:complete
MSNQSIEDHIQYDQIIDQKMREVVKEALERVKSSGLSGEHHFLIAFNTRHKSVNIPDRLKKKYPTEMTIVIQHQFDDLKVYKDRFSVSLSFDGSKENISIPYNALISFADPGVKFGLKFNFVAEIEEVERSLEELDLVPSKKVERKKEETSKGKLGVEEDNEKVISVDFMHKKESRS